MTEKDADDEEKLGTTTITFRIKARDKKYWQLVADEITHGNITRLIKKAVDTYVYDKGPRTSAYWNKYIRNLVMNFAQSNDPVSIQAKWEEGKPKLIMACVQQYEERVKQLQEDLNRDLENVLIFRIQ